MFVKASSENSSITYFKCNGSGHKAYNCNIKKIYHTITTKIWISKEIISINPKRSKKAWVLNFKK